MAADPLLDAEAQVVGGALRRMHGTHPLEAGEARGELADQVRGRAEPDMKPAPIGLSKINGL